MSTYRVIERPRRHYAVRDLLATHGAEQRMSRRDNCSDNAQAESCRSRLKTELLDGDFKPGFFRAGSK